MNKQFTVYIESPDGAGTSAHYGLSGAIAHLVGSVKPGDNWTLYVDGEEIAHGRSKRYPVASVA